jgi:hypothetical protein
MALGKRHDNHYEEAWKWCYLRFCRYEQRHHPSCSIENSVVAVAAAVDHLVMNFFVPVVLNIYLELKRCLSAYAAVGVVDERFLLERHVLFEN